MYPDIYKVKEALPNKIRWAIPLVLFLMMLLLSYVNLSPSNSVVKLTARTSNPERTQIFYRTSFEDYSPVRSRMITMESGLHEHTFRIYPSYNIVSIRLDPAVQETELELQRFTFEWDGEVIIDLHGDELMTAFVPLQHVALEERENFVHVRTTGNDPILELNASAYTKQYLHRLLIEKTGKALLWTAIFMIPFFYVTSNRYLEAAHSIYPGKKVHWFYWGAASWAAGAFLVLVTPIKIVGNSAFLSFAAYSFIWGCYLFVPFFWLCTRELLHTEAARSSKLDWIWYALPAIIVWNFYLLCFWPGQMSPDSFDQWKQIVRFSFKDWHPVFHTLNIWLVTRLALSPATVAITQIITLASCAGWALSILQRYGVPRWVLWVTSVFFAVLPVNGFMVITLWKDIAYSIVHLVLAMYVFQIVMLQGAWLKRPANWLKLGLIVALVSLYRHNGIVPALGICVLLGWFYRRYWQGVTAAFLLALVIHIGITGPLYNALEVKRGNPLYVSTQRLLHAVKKLGKEKSNEKIEKVSGRTNEGTSEDIRKKDDYGFVGNRLYSASRLWRVKPMTYFHKRIEYVNIWLNSSDNEHDIKYVSANTYGIDEHSLIPAGKQLLFKLFEQSRHAPYLFWMWRPAVYLYLLTGLVIVVSYRFRNRLYLLLGPAIINSLPIFLIIIHKSVFRYHYPIVVLGTLLILPLMFMGPVSGREPESSGVTI